jgi:S-adenosylmethionine hydrolase
MLSIAPHVTVIDVTHDVPAHDVRSGSLTLVRSVQYLNPGVVLAVVDPGVGTDRRAIAVEVGEEGEAVFVGPDNGLLAPAVAMTGGATRAVALTNPKYQLEAPGPTFAGRDIFAPAAAHLAAGVPLDELGDVVDPISLVPGLVPLPQEQENGVVLASVLWVDHFGNVQLNLGPEDIEPFGDRITLRWSDQVRTARRASTYAAIKPGEVGLVVDSYGMVSVALDRASASDHLRLRTGDGITLASPG